MRLKRRLFVCIVPVRCVRAFLKRRRFQSIRFFICGHWGHVDKPLPWDTSLIACRRCWRIYDRLRR